MRVERLWRTGKALIVARQCTVILELGAQIKVSLRVGLEFGVSMPPRVRLA